MHLHFDEGGCRVSEVYVARDRPMTRPALRVLVYGAGAVGSWLAARLALTGVEVTVLGRPATVAALRSTGLALALDDQTYVTYARYVEGVAEIGPAPDLVFLAVKSYDVAATLPDLYRLAAEGATVVTMQNGIGAEEEIVAALGPTHLLAGAITVSVSMTEPGLVSQHTDAGGVAFASLPDGPTPGTVLALFDEASVRAVGVAAYRDLKWSKLLLNLLANAQAAILDTDAATVVRDPILFALERRAFREAQAVMAAIPAHPRALPGYDVPRLAAAMRLPAPTAWRLLRGRIGGGRGEKRPSLALALAAGRRETEIDALNGAVARYARAFGIAAPVNTTFAALVGRLATHPDTCPPFAERRAWLMRELWARGVRVSLRNPNK